MMNVSPFTVGQFPLEDYPGTGKTTLAKALARSARPSSACSSRPICCRRTSSAIFTHILLADEINRASPRTQSALLDAHAVHRDLALPHRLSTLPALFFVIATQNPVEFLVSRSRWSERRDRLAGNLARCCSR